MGGSRVGGGALRVLTIASVERAELFVETGQLCVHAL
jgi:hypothetical protein